jgi:hypothetical protein
MRRNPSGEADSRPADEEIRRLTDIRCSQKQTTGCCSEAD